MARTDIEMELRELERRLLNYQKEINGFNAELQQQVDIINQTSEMKRKIEQKLLDVLNNVNIKVQRLSEECHFRGKYLEDVKSVIYGEDSQNVLDDLQNACNNAKTHYVEIEELIASTWTDVRRTEEEIRILRKRLESEVV